MDSAKHDRRPSPCWAFVVMATLALLVDGRPGFGQSAPGLGAAPCIVRGTLDVAVPQIFPGVPTVPVADVDGSGNVLVAWGYQFSNPGLLFTSRFEQSTGWQPTTPLDTGPAQDRVLRLTLDANSAGDALLVWSGREGIYASAYVPGSGWQPTETVDSGPNPFSSFAKQVAVAVDAAGNGLLVWVNGNGDELTSSRYMVGSGWTPPEILGNPGFSSAPFHLAMSPDGDAQVLWLRWPNGIWSLFASRFTAAMGWEPAVLLKTSSTGFTTDIAVNDMGVAMAVWVAYDPTSEAELLSATFLPGLGWQAPEFISSHFFSPRNPSIDIDQAGNAVVVWRTAADKRVLADRYLAGSGWQGNELLESYGAGDPLDPQVAMDGQGNAVASWAAPGPPSIRESRRFQPTTGWQRFNFLGGPIKGSAVGAGVAMNDNGDAVATFTDSYSAFDGQFFNVVTDITACRFSSQCEAWVLDVDIQGGGGFGIAGSNPPGLFCGTECSERFVDGTVVALAAFSTSGFFGFAGWVGGGCGVSEVCSLTLDADTHLTATFSDFRTLSVSAAGNGSGTVQLSPAGNDCGPGCFQYLTGTTVTLTATPDPGSTFTGWTTGECGENPTCVLVMDGQTEAVASFDVLPFAMDVSFLPAGEVGVAYQASLGLSGGKLPHDVQLLGGSLPAGINLNGGDISGTPTKAGKSRIRLEASDELGSTLQRKLKLKIYKQLQIPTKKLKQGKTGKAYKGKLKVKGGKKPFAWSVAGGKLPDGVVLLPDKGRLRGVPIVPGETQVTFRVTDSLGGLVEKALTITIVEK